MFKRLVVGTSPRTMAAAMSSPFGEQEPYSPGGLAEALVFYDRVYLTGTSSELAELVQQIGVGTFYRLCEAGFVRSRLTDEKKGIFWDADELVFDPEFDAKHADPHAELAEGLEERLLCLGADKDTTDKVVRFVAADDGTWDTDNELPDRQKARDALIQQARRTPRFLSNIIRAYLLNDAPTAKLPEDLVRLADDGSFRIKDVYGYARNIITLHGMISPAGATAGYIRLREILDHLTVGMSLKAEFGSDPSLAAAITHIVDGAVQRVEPGSQISRFQERRFNNARAVARAIESKERTFDDLLNLLTKKKRFSAWLQEQKLDQDLFDAFMGEMCAGSWIERLTPKSLRFILFSGGGVLADLAITATTGIPGVGTAAGFSLGAFDTFLIAKLGENWNPHQFVNGPLAQFVSPQVHSSGR